MRTFRDLVDLIAAKVDSRRPLETQRWAGRAIGSGTVNAFVRRLYGAVRAPRAPDPGRRGATPNGTGSTFDRHRSPWSTCTTSTTGPSGSWSASCCARRSSEKERVGRRPGPLQFVVLDELNKYAPREGSSPIKEILLDVAERGPLARHHPDRRAADRQRGRAAHRGQLRDPGGRAARRRRGRRGASTASCPRSSASGPPSSSPARCSSSQPELPVPAGDPVPVPRLGHPGRRGRRQPHGPGPLVGGGGRRRRRGPLRRPASLNCASSAGLAGAGFAEPNHRWALLRRGPGTCHKRCVGSIG